MTNLQTSLIVIAVISIPLAFIGAKRRIGYWWSLFFLITLFIIPGIIFMILSPPIKNSHPDSKTTKTLNTINGILSICFCVAALVSVVKKYNEIQELEKIGYTILPAAYDEIWILSLLIIGSLGYTTYMFYRSERNQRIYDQLQNTAAKTFETTPQKQRSPSRDHVS